ncbi:DUF190 domain-containing protein [Streptomyces iconiensis]|uniref:DUF190 domain-containing protein n=1 Tax=Streptomyces iconiensis TaxID=1384038 RepID=A0ABT6ZNA5_9ACTN|nr:DUF190 domain-containing protein [Streptomyces iconiensis]MDJ1130537.1 DUF190 domain-containing protein [Streptomyces iconiensis]
MEPPAGPYAATEAGTLHRVTVYVRSTDRSGHVPLYVELVRRARREGVMGASALPCVAGFGRAGVLHGAGRHGVPRDRPVMVLVVDTPERVARFVRVLAQIAPESFAVLDEVTGGVLSARTGADE